MTNDTPTYAPAVDTTARRTPRIRKLLAELAGVLNAGDNLNVWEDGVAELITLTREMLARPIPGETVNVGYVIRHVIDGHPAEPGLLRSWWVAGEREDGAWVTWEAAALDGSMSGSIGYNAGDYFGNDDPAVNRRRALRSLAERAGVPVATERMDASEAFSQLMSRYRPYQLRYDDADALLIRASQHLRQEVRGGKAGLTAYLASDGTMRYDLREVG